MYLVAIYIFEIIEHLSNATHRHAIHADEEKLQFLTWHPSGLTPWQIRWSLSVC